MGYFQVPQMFFFKSRRFRRFTQISGIKRYLSIKEKVQFLWFGIEPFLYNRQTQKKICVNL